jgi:uncharacterized protein YsxB (DUF464 family)
VIKLTIIRNDVDGFIEEFTLSGHAEFAEPGKDLVCAAVSGISFGTINAIETLLNIKLTIKMNEKNGFLHCIAPQKQENAVHEKAQLLLEGMVVSLQSIASEYGKYITIYD